MRGWLVCSGRSHQPSRLRGRLHALLSTHHHTTLGGPRDDNQTKIQRLINYDRGENLPTISLRIHKLELFKTDGLFSCGWWWCVWRARGLGVGELHAPATRHPPVLTPSSPSRL